MKSERRHELQHNELADWLAKMAETLKPYQNAILAAVAVVLIALVGYTLLSRESAANASRAWDDMSLALGSKDIEQALSKVAEAYPGTIVAYSAQTVLANVYLANGCDGLFKNKATALTELKKAIELYDSVLAKCRESSLREQATFGLARAKESKGDPESIGQAIKLYGDVADQWPQGAFAVVAQQRVKDLERPSTKIMYDRFAQFDPKPAFSAEPGERPAFEMKDLPAEPAPAATEAASPPTTEAKPAAEPAKPGVEQPAEKPAEPAAEKPAEDAKQ